MAKKTSRKSVRRAVPKKKKAAPKAVSSVLVVNMMPRGLSGESNQDSEPTIAVNAANPLQIAGSAFTPDPGQGNLAPIYISVDGGNTWTLNSIVPSSAADGSATADITVAFSTASNKLYAGIIRLPFPGNRPRLNILRTDNFQSGTAMKVLVDRTGRGVDQPYVQAATAEARMDRRFARQYIRTGPFMRFFIPGVRSVTAARARRISSWFATITAAVVRTNSSHSWTAATVKQESV